MRTVLICDATAVTEYATMALSGGESALDRVYAYADGLSFSGAVLLATPALPSTPPKGWSRVDRESWSAEELLTAMIDASGEADRVVFVAGDEPLLQQAVTERMLSLQEEYRTEYTFADGYPEGITPEIVTPAILPVLRGLNEEKPEPPGRDLLFRLIQRDINAFDLETEIAPVDLRLLRASVTCDNRRNFLLARGLIEAGITGEEQILRDLPERQELLRTLPAYFQLQVTNSYPQRVSYEPFYDLQAPEPEQVMELQRFEDLLDRIEAFAPESVVSIGYRGEPGLHPRILEFIGAVERRRGLSLYLETSGVGWPPAAVTALAEMELTATTIIVLLDAADPEAYRRLRGEGFEEARRFAGLMREAHPDRCYLQATRLVEEQESLEAFYAAYKDERPIIQKYNSYCGTLPDRRVTDLSPLNRFPCWHLRRDLTVLLDGTVPLCGQDLHMSSPRGNVFENSLEEVWNAGGEVYGAHTRGEYPGICAACDEYYTYNA